MKENKASRWIFGYIKRYFGAILLLSVLGAAVSAGYIVLALLSKNVLDMAGHGLNRQFYEQCLLLAVVILAQILITIFSGMLSVRVSARLQNTMRADLFVSYTQKNYKEIHAIHSGDVLNRFTSDIDVVVGGIADLIPSTISLITKIVAGGAVLLVLNPVIAVVIIGVGAVVSLFARVLGQSFKSLHKEVQQTEGVTRSFLQECFSNIVVIKSFLSGSPMLKRLSVLMGKNFNAKIRQNRVSVLSRTGTYFFFTAGYYGTLVWGAVSIANGTITIGTLMAFLQIVLQLRAPLQNVSGLVPRYFSTIASAERILTLFGLGDEPEALKDEQTAEVANSMNCIKALELCFGYENEMIINQLNAVFKKGSMTAVVGSSGAGKSTFFKLLLGLYAPTSGSLTVETPKGQYTVDASLRGLFAYVPQGNMILSGTIRENIALCRPDADEKEIFEAAKTAQIFEFIESLEAKFDTVVGERGLGLSEGQVQRVAVARALLCNAPVLLLDECTSALDIETELKMLSALKKLKNKTVLLITHRSEAAALCDTTLQIGSVKFDSTAAKEQ